MRPTANSIWRSLRATNKKHIVITGIRGVGKTTLFNSLVSKKYGFTTRAIPQDRVELHFDGLACETDNYVIGRYAPEKCEDGMHPMQPEINTLNTLATIIENMPSPDIDSYITIDEIGFLEEASPAFCQAITNLFDKYHVIATVRKQNTNLISSIISRDDILFINLDNPFGNVGSIIMASGLGTRFGDNKLMTPLHNKPLISYILSTAQQLFNKSIVVTRHASVCDYCNSINQEVILHEFPHRSDTARLGTQHLMSQSVDSIIFLQGDQPLVSLDSIMALLICATNCPYQIIRLSYHGEDCSPVLFPSCYFGLLTKLPEGKGGNYIAHTHQDTIIRIEADSELEIIDIDTPEDIARIINFNA